MKKSRILLIYMLLFVTILGVSQNLEEGLVAYYPFSGDANDQGPYGLDGAVTGAVLTSDKDGNINAAYSFNLPGDQIDLVDVAHFSFSRESFSISYWFKTSSDKTYQTVIANGCGAWSSGFLTGLSWEIGSIIFAIGANYNAANSVGISTVIDTWNDGNWHHVVCIVDSENEKAMIYVDGDKQVLKKYDFFGVTGGALINGDTELDITGVDYIADASLFTTSIGRTLYEQNFVGDLDEVRIYDRALTDAEITLLYQGTQSISNILSMDSFRIYPNPVYDILFYESERFDIQKIIIYDITGRIMMTKSNIVNSNSQIDISDFPSGIYILSILTKEGKYIEKIQKN